VSLRMLQQCFSEKILQHDSIYNMSQNRGYAVPPPLPSACNAEPSELYQIVQRHSHHPPILQTNSWTLAVPYKEQCHHRTPSESIGNNYSPRAKGLKMTKLQHRTASQNGFLILMRLLPCFYGVLVPEAHDLIRSCFHRDASCRASILSQGRHKLRDSPAPSSRPISPTEQLDIMRRQEENMTQTGPTDRDLERYMYYITTGVESSVLAPQPRQQMINILKLLPPDSEDSGKHLQILRANMEEEVKKDYYLSLKKSIVDYILMDPSERQRLSIHSIPRPFPRRVIRAPVPWTTSYRDAHMWQSEHLYTITPIMVLLYSSLRFVKMEDLFSASLPLLPSEFEELVQRHLLPVCQTVSEQSDLWIPFILKSEHDSDAPFSVQEFFNCVAALMSLQLRSLVIQSLENLLQFFMIHEEGNDFGEVFDEMQYVQPQVLLVKLQLDESHIVFSPSFQECWEVINRAFMEIIRSAEKLPRVECILSPNIKNVYLCTVMPDESLVTNLINKAKDVFNKNTVGPQKYLNVYQKYSNLLDNTAKQDVSAFLKEKHSLKGFSKSFKLLWVEIASLRITVPLSMFCLYVGKLNNDLCDRAGRLKDKIVMFEVEENRELNKG
uniref:Uncharacterized protein n=1 Tax=Amphiprion percula TaxID=161767 RepID=A0A3P8TPE1_AMPPE